ncbi:MAG: glycosyltransferase [Conexivisphaerales archaeon]
MIWLRQMATDENLLGIYIPTYNRAMYLENLLNSIVREASSFGIPIFISDNASNDQTMSVVEKFKSVYKSIEYVRNEYNIGPYENILKVMKVAGTEYVWVIGDDDAIKEGGITTVVGELKNGYDYIVLNSTVYNKTMNIVRSKKVIDCRTSRIYAEGQSEKLLLDLNKWGYNGFLSSMIIKRTLISDLVVKFRDSNFVLYGNYWLPLALFYEAIRNARGKFLCNPIIKSRDNPRISGDDYWKYMVSDRIKAVVYLQQIGYDIKILRKVLRISLKGLLFLLVGARAYNPESKIYNQISDSEFIGFKMRMVVYLFDYLPQKFILLLNDVIMKLKGNK